MNAWKEKDCLLCHLLLGEVVFVFNELVVFDPHPTADVVAVVLT